MSALFAHWRLKLLALLLAVTLLGAVAFSENPISVQTRRNVPVTYQGLPSNLVLINPETAVNVNIVGTQDSLAQVGQESVYATVDASRLHHQPGTPPTQETVTIVAHVLTGGVTLQNGRIPISVLVDDQTTVQLPISVKSPNVAEGWEIKRTQVLDNLGHPAVETVTGAASQLAGLKAYAEVDTTIQNDNVVSPGAPVRFLAASGKKLDWPPSTIPITTSNPDFVTVNITARQPNQSRQVFVRVSGQGTASPGFMITGVTVSPAFVVISGPADLVSQFDSVPTSTVNFQGLNSNRAYRALLQLPDGVSANYTLVTVSVTVAAIPNPKPTPRPSPSPSPTPSPSP